MVDGFEALKPTTGAVLCVSQDVKEEHQAARHRDRDVHGWLPEVSVLF